jgi:hypothetical protein
MIETTSTSLLTKAARLCIREDGPWLLAVSGPHADEGGEILEGVYAQDCTSIEDSRIRGRSAMAGSRDTGSGVGPASTQRQYLPT